MAQDNIKFRITKRSIILVRIILYTMELFNVITCHKFSNRFYSLYRKITDALLEVKQS
jgi:hypothetical protein